MKIQYKLGGKVMGKSSNIIELNGGFPIAMFDYWRLCSNTIQYTECFWRHCKKLLQPLLNRIANCSLFWSAVSRQVQRWKTAGAYISMRGVVATTFVAVNCWVLKSCLYPCELSFIHKEFRKFNWCFTTQSRCPTSPKKGKSSPKKGKYGQTPLATVPALIANSLRRWTRAVTVSGNPNREACGGSAAFCLANSAVAQLFALFTQYKSPLTKQT